MPTYRVTFYRRYLPHPERDEAQRETVVADNETQVRDIFADCEIYKIEVVGMDAAEQERRTGEIAADAAWLGALQYGDDDLGTHFVISGGEVLEIPATFGSGEYEEDLPF